jgi:hypothetical protein
MPVRAAVLALLVGALLAVGITACGDDTETTSGTISSTENVPAGPTTSTTTSTGDTTTQTTSTTDEDAGDDDSGGVGPGGGSGSGSNGEDTEDNDIPPPPGSQAEELEENCDKNPGAC